MLIWHLHTLWNDHKSNYLPHSNLLPYFWPYALFFMHITSLWLFYFKTRGLYLLVPFTYFSSPTSLSSATPPIFSLFLSLFSFCIVCFVFYSPHIRFSRQEHWSGLPFPSPVHGSEKWKWSHSVMSDSQKRGIETCKNSAFLGNKG